MPGRGLPSVKGANMIEGLKPCPWCKKNEQIEFKQRWQDDYYCTDEVTYHIRCDYCGALGPENSKSFKIAREEWNERV